MPGIAGFQPKNVRKMSLRCGIIGLANTGKTTLFNCMSNVKAETSSFAFTSNKSNLGVIRVPDRRLEELEKLQPTEKLVPAVVEIIDIPGLAKGSNEGEGVGNSFLADIREADALIHVLRCFDDEAVHHMEGSVNPLRDLEILDFELQVRDTGSVDKKIARLEKMAKAGVREARYGLEVLQKVKQHLESFRNVRDLDLDENERREIRDLSLLTAKPVIYVCNVDEASAAGGNRYTNEVRGFLEGQNTDVLVVAAKLAEEIADLESGEDRMEFLHDAGLSEPGVDRLIRSAYSLLNLLSFFTVGPKEIKAWTIHRGMTAPQAAGVIHSDLERGFIRAEVMKYNDFVTLGSEQACKEKGKFFVEGKNYTVEDGDILHIRFNV